MIKNYLIIAIRNILRQKAYSFINIFGLAIGITCAIFIYLWVYDEVTFDHHHENLEQIYRVEQDQFYNGEAYHVTVNPYPAGEGWKQDIPEIIDAVRFAYTGSLLMKYDEKAFFEPGIVAVDSSIFKMFTFPLKYGDKHTALSKPYSMVLTEEIAEKYFGDANPMGQIIRVDNQYEFTVTGVLEKLPDNSSFYLRVLVPFDFCKTTGDYNDSWGSNSIQTYVQLAQNADPAPVDQKLIDVVIDHRNYTEEEAAEYQTKFMLAPLKKMHLHAYFGFGNPPGQIQNVLIFATIGIFILLIACINFMNLSTARSTKRSREIGMRKVSGAFRKNIIFQFFNESLITTIIATLFAVAIVSILLQQFNTLAGKQIASSVFKTSPFILGILGIVIFTAFVAGSYPALHLSKFIPVKVLKGEGLKSSSKAPLRKILVVVQFTLSIFLIIGTITIYKQLSHMQNKKLGYDKEHVLYVRMFGDINNSYDLLKQSFKQNPVVEYVTASSHLPSMIGSNSGGADWDGKDPDESTLISLSVIDFDYVKALGIDIVKGRDISEEYPGDRAVDSTGSFLINEELAKVIGEEDPTGMRFSFLGVSQGKIVGVMKNFHFQSMRNKIEPLAIAPAFPQYLQYIMIRIKPGNVKLSVKELENTWNEVLPNYPFEYKFLDEDYDRMYRGEERMGNLLKYFAIMAILIACLGLFGLASFLAEKRTKEIGIRKAMGSTSMSVVYLLSKEFARLVIISIIIAIPVTWFFLDKWIQNYAFRTELSWWIFASSAVAALVFALLTVSYQSVKAANSNPASSLRHE